MKPQTNTDKYRYLLILSALVCVHLWIMFLSSCNSAPTDLRKLAPAETLVYLETNDLGKTLQALTDNSAFQELAKKQTDFSALENIQVAVAVTGFETSEKQITDEQSILNFKPHFVAIADTHAWEWQTRRFAEEKLGAFVSGNYGGEVNQTVSDKHGGKLYTWTATDGRKMFAFVQSSQIFFGNDESAIEKCLAVKRGEADSLLKNENLARARKNADSTLAFGYISTDGVAQIANLAGVSTAIKTTEDDDGRSFIARVLPQILQKTTKEISWTAAKTGQGIEDKILVSLNGEVASVFKETLLASSQPTIGAAEFLPADVFSVTRYNLQNPQIAWRSLLLIMAKNTDALSGKILVNFSNSLLEPYGISDAETFLSATGSEILTAKFDAEGEKSVVIVGVKDAEKIKKTIAQIDFKPPPENAEIWKSKDGDIAAAFVENKLILGDFQSVLRCLQAKQSGQNFTKTADFKRFADTKAVSITFSKDTDSAEKIVRILANLKDENKRRTTIYLTETRFTDKGIERKTVSDFGLLGTIVEQLDK
ncbi:MAG: hypothetical protein M3Q33_15270 [Acidobacteriota bacterium]|nr:hypothetical protein [Acidobacteriota bacterium]